MECKINILTQFLHSFLQKKTMRLFIKGYSFHKNKVQTKNKYLNLRGKQTKKNFKFILYGLQWTSFTFKKYPLSHPKTVGGWAKFFHRRIAYWKTCMLRCASPTNFLGEGGGGSPVLSCARPARFVHKQGRYILSRRTIEHNARQYIITNSKTWAHDP